MFRSIGLPKAKREQRWERRDWDVSLSRERRLRRSAHPLNASRHLRLSLLSSMLTPSGSRNGANCTDGAISWNVTSFDLRRSERGDHSYALARPRCLPPICLLWSSASFGIAVHTAFCLMNRPRRLQTRRGRETHCAPGGTMDDPILEM